MIQTSELFKAIGLAIGLICLAILGFAVICRANPTTDADFSQAVQLTFAASDRYNSSNTVFILKIHSTSSNTIWPGHKATLSLFVDGSRIEVPRPTLPWMATKRLRPWGGRESAWWMSLDQAKEWIGPGNHELLYTLRNVTSNVLRITIPETGRMTCDPEYTNSAWSQER